MEVGQIKSVPVDQVIKNGERVINRKLAIARSNQWGRGKGRMFKGLVFTV